MSSRKQEWYIVQRAVARRAVADEGLHGPTRPRFPLGGRLLRNLLSFEIGCALDLSLLISTPRKNALELCPTAGIEEFMR